MRLREWKNRAWTRMAIGLVLCVLTLGAETTVAVLEASPAAAGEDVAPPPSESPATTADPANPANEPDHTGATYISYEDLEQHMQDVNARNALIAQQLEEFNAHPPVADQASPPRQSSPQRVAAHRVAGSSAVADKWRQGLARSNQAAANALAPNPTQSWDPDGSTWQAGSTAWRDMLFLVFILALALALALAVGLRLSLEHHERGPGAMRRLFRRRANPNGGRGS